MALRDENTRLHVGSSMAKSAVYEHKLEFSRYLQTADGKVLLDAMARASGTDAEAVLKPVWHRESLNNSFRAGQGAGDADAWFTNYGFNHNSIPTAQDSWNGQ
jgi:hypothetical protein